MRPHSPAGLPRAMARTLRPKQWAKNVLVFLGPAAAGLLGHWPDLWRTTVAFVIFCAVASGMYIVNDLKDIEEDRLHHRKRHRPIPSGDLSYRAAVTLAATLVTSGLLASVLVLGWEYLVLMVVYIALTLSYSLGLKNVPILEFGIVAFGFTIRARAGGAALHLPFSPYVLFLALTGALFLVVGKRMAEINTLGDVSVMHRSVLSEYPPAFIQGVLIISAAVTITTYSSWSLYVADTLGGNHIILEATIVPVLFGVLHVLRLLYQGSGGAPEDLVFKDRAIQALGIVWAALFLLGVYWPSTAAH
jgi:decaprenyl-phosphate phosphoribosyltransferase